MKVVWKYEFEIEDEIEIKMPVGAKILKVTTQNGNPVLYALTDDDFYRVESRQFRLLGTGHKINVYPGEYIGTFMIRNERLVFHLFEKKHSD